jgi:hypothetical protein
MLVSLISTFITNSGHAMCKLTNFSLVLTILLVACGGGGGGSSPSYVAPTSWGQVSANSKITVSGDSQQGNYTWDSGTNKLTAASFGAQQTGASYTASYGSNGVVNYVNIQTAGGTNLTFTSADSTFGTLRINSGIDAAISNSGTSYALAAEPSAYGWNYQSFGVWVTGAGTGSGTAGSTSVGWATPNGSVPTTGTGNYTGYTGGRYSASDGSYFFTSSAMTANANFATRSIAFSTTATQTTPDLINLTNNSNLNLSGTLTYAANSNQFTGTVTSVSGMTGTATGRFYGPAAQEIGGTFGVSGGGLNVYGGAFGGKK